MEPTVVSAPPGLRIEKDSQPFCEHVPECSEAADHLRSNSSSGVISFFSSRKLDVNDGSAVPVF